LAKRQILPAPKICLFASAQALCVRSVASRRPKRYLTCIRRDSGRARSLKIYFSFCKELDVRTLWLAAARTRPPATSRAEHAQKLAGSEQPSERRAKPRPSGAERGAGDVGAPRGAVH